MYVVQYCQVIHKLFQEQRTLVVARALEINEVERGLQASIEAVQVSHRPSD